MGFKRKNRNIEVFDISLMAVVTKAMGAFLVMMVMLLPSYYAMRSRPEPAAGELRQQVDDLQRRLREMQQNIGKYTENPEELKRQLASLQDELTLARARVDDLQTRLSQSITVRERLERENQQLLAQRQQLEAERNDAMARMRAAENDAKALQAQLNDLDPLLKGAAMPSYANLLIRTKREIDCVISTSHQARVGYPANEPDEVWVARAEMKVRLFHSYGAFPNLTDRGQKILGEMKERATTSGTIARTPPPNPMTTSDFVMTATEGSSQRYFRGNMQNGEMLHFAALPVGPEMMAYIGMEIPQGISECPVAVGLTLMGRNVVAPFALPDLRVSTSRIQRVLIAVLDPLKPPDILRRPAQADIDALKSKFAADYELPAAPGVR